MAEAENASHSPENTPGFLRIPLAAHLAQHYGSETREALEDLAVSLETVLPEGVKVVRRGGWFSKKKPLEQIQVELEGATLTLELTSDSGRPKCTKKRVVRGIVLATEELTLAEWLNAVASALEANAANNQRAREALEKWIR